MRSSNMQILTAKVIDIMFGLERTASQAAESEAGVTSQNQTAERTAKPAAHLSRYALH